MATTEKRLDVTDLDFDDIKGNLKTFMKNQSDFTDYDFEGSGMNALLDVLSYNTHYLAMNLNMSQKKVPVKLYGNIYLHLTYWKILMKLILKMLKKLFLLKKLQMMEII